MSFIRTYHIVVTREATEEKPKLEIIDCMWTFESTAPELTTLEFQKALEDGVQRAMERKRHEST